MRHARVRAEELIGADIRTERAVQEALTELSRGRTTIAIAHRLSTVRDADEIAVVENGRVIEAGTHAELLALDGRYAAMVTAQAHAGTEASVPTVAEAVAA